MINANPITLYVDVSETLGLDVRTGIQRVVREVTRKSEAGDGQFRIVPVVAIGRRFFRLSVKGAERLAFPPPNTYQVAAPHRTSLPVRVARALLGMVPSLLKLVRTSRAQRLFDERIRLFATGGPLAIGPGDRVVLADTYSSSSALAAGVAARDAGAALIALTYDLFPITHAHLLDQGSSENFAATVPRGMDLSDGVLTISDWCVGQLRSFGVTKPLARFHLGYDIPVPPETGLPSSAWLDGMWEADAFLMVGTIATSKGHGIALTAFEKLWAEGRDQRLVMIGRPGWEAETLLRRLNSHPEAGRRLFLVHGATDAMVNDAFDRATAVIVGSEVEGFGLPLVEALARHRPVIASDIDVFTEIAGDLPRRYPQRDSAALAAAVREVAADPLPHAERARQFRWLTWDQARDQFASAVDRLAIEAGR